MPRTITDEDFWAVAKHSYVTVNENEVLADDTIYGSYNCIKYDYALPHVQAFNERTSQTYKSSIFGQSCVSMDKELSGSQYTELPIGDKIFVTNFGAYTCASSSSFNGFSPPVNKYLYIPYLKRSFLRNHPYWAQTGPVFLAEFPGYGFAHHVRHWERRISDTTL